MMTSSSPVKMGFSCNYLSLPCFRPKQQQQQHHQKRNVDEFHLPEQCDQLLKDTTSMTATNHKHDETTATKSKSCFINYGQEDQMQISGYRLNHLKNFITWSLIVFSGGLLRLLFHWIPHWLLIATCTECPFECAEKILITESYKNKHKIYHVKNLSILTPEMVYQLETKEGDGGSCLLQVHFGNGDFKQLERLMFFKLKKLTYVYDFERNEFVKLKGLDVGVKADVLHLCHGLTKQQQFMRRLVYGRSLIDIPEKTILTLFCLEVLNPFYIFQILSFCLWFADDYYYYALAILTMSAGSITMAVLQTRRNQRNLKSTVHSSDVVTVQRPNVEKLVQQQRKRILSESDDDDSNEQKEHKVMIETEILSTELLVPGDVIEIPTHGCLMHCDAVLLTGNCIVNESMLTGESVPVTKTSLPNVSNLYYDTKEHSRHTLYCGTQVIQTRYYGNEKVLAVVIRTGFTTAKGGLVRSILYPPPVDFRFEKDSYRFVLLLAAIASFGFIYTVVTKYYRGESVRDLVLEALDLITVVVPPSLPAAMTVGRFYAQKRLQTKHQIYCISPRSINVSGSIDCVCFDKTGTLTEDGLDMLCVVPITNRYFDLAIKRIDQMSYNTFFYGMVSCHSLTIIDKHVTGDPLDLKMFESTSWILEEHETSDHTKFNMIFPTVVRAPHLSTKSLDSSKQIGIIREFPFSSTHQRMGVIVRHLNSTHFEYYCKGSPEMILNFVVPETIPEDFHHVLELYTQQGYRVIALAHKVLWKMAYAKVMKVQRDVVECDLVLLGLIVLENRLKPDTTPCIDMLNQANIRTIMVTGDNILTAVSVAKECGMITQGQCVITVNVDTNTTIPQLYYTLTNTKNKQITSTNGYVINATGAGDASFTDSASCASLETIESALVSNSIKTELEVVPARKKKQSKRCPPSLFNNYRFALTGKVWSVARKCYPELVPRLVARGAIFARMSPEQKQQLVEELQGIGYYVAMCGDGANDCGALKAAHTGISLSDSESSVASPFTSKTPNITCVPNIIKEGRAALVTSFGIFKYMASYSLCQFISVMILYSIESNLTDIQYLYVDLFIISIFAFFFGRTEAYEGPLVKETPLSSLISLSPVLSLVLQLFLVALFQIVAFEHVQTEDWFVAYNSSRKDASVGCYENYTIFTISSFQYVILAVVFSKGKPYRQSIFSNYGFILSSLGLTVFNVYLALSPVQFLQENFELVIPPVWNFKFYMLMYALVHFVCATFIEVCIIEYFVFKKLRYKSKSRRCKYLEIERHLQSDTKWPTLSVDFHSNLSPKSFTPTPKYKTEIVIEHENAFTDKNHVLNTLLNRPEIRNSELKLNASTLVEKASSSLEMNQMGLR